MAFFMAASLPLIFAACQCDRYSEFSGTIVDPLSGLDRQSNIAVGTVLVEESTEHGRLMAFQLVARVTGLEPGGFKSPDQRTALLLIGTGLVKGSAPVSTEPPTTWQAWLVHERLPKQELRGSAPEDFWREFAAMSEDGRAATDGAVRLGGTVHIRDDTKTRYSLGLDLHASDAALTAVKVQGLLQGHERCRNVLLSGVGTVLLAPKIHAMFRALSIGN